MICFKSRLVLFCSCFSVLLALRLPHLENLSAFYMFVQFAFVCFVYFLFLLVSGKGCSIRLCTGLFSYLFYLPIKCIYSPALKKWGYTGLAMSFLHSMTAKLKCILLNNFYVCGPTLGVILLELCPLVGFQNLKCILLNTFYVCGPSSMNLIPHLVSKVRKVYWQNGGHGPITLGVMSLDRFQILPFLNIFVTDFSGTMWKLESWKFV